MIGPTRAEVIGEQLDIINADYTRAVVKKKVTCEACNGHGDMYRKETETYSSCDTCLGFGFIEIEDIDIDTIPENLKRHVKGFKMGRGGKLLPEFKDKDKAIVNLMNILGLNKQTLEITRNSYGQDATDEELAAEAVALRQTLGLPEPVLFDSESDGQDAQ